MSQRKAVTAVIARRYQRASHGQEGLILDELCATTGHRSHARKALRAALGLALVPAPRVRPPTYGPREIAALRTCWVVLGAPADKRLAPFLPELVSRLRVQGELNLTDELAASLSRMSAATIDRRLEHQITFARSRPGNKNDGAHAEQKNWSVVRQLVGYHRYDTDAEQDLLSQLWAAQSLVTNYFRPQHKLISKVRRGAKVSKKYETATTPTSGPGAARP